MGLFGKRKDKAAPERRVPTVGVPTAGTTGDGGRGNAPGAPTPSRPGHGGEGITRVGGADAIDTIDTAQEASRRGVNLDKMSRRERREYLRRKSQDWSTYPQLLATRPRRGYRFHSDWFEIDGMYATILALFHDDGAEDRWGAFWGVNRIPRHLPDGVTVVMFTTTERQSDKWVETNSKTAEKVSDMDVSEQGSGGTRSAAERSAKVNDDILEALREIRSGASYLNVQYRLMVRARTLEDLDVAVAEIQRQYSDDFRSGMRVAAYPGDQRKELASILSRNSAHNGSGYYLTSSELSGSYSLVTNGLNDDTGEFIGPMTGDLNTSAIVFDPDLWDGHVIVADDGWSSVAGVRSSLSDMWGSKIGQCALMGGHRAVHIILDEARLVGGLGPAMPSITSIVDLNHGDINMFEVFGRREDQLSLFSGQLDKLCLMAEVIYAGNDGKLDPQMRPMFEQDLKSVITEYYVSQGMWRQNPEEHQDELRLVGIAHTQCPTLQSFQPYLKTNYKAYQRGGVDIDTVRTAKQLYGVFDGMLLANGDLFNVTTKDDIDGVIRARRVVYDLSSLSKRGRAVTMAQLVNVIHYAVSVLDEGDVVIIHGADKITDLVRPYVRETLDSFVQQRHGRVAYLYPTVGAMLKDKDFNDFPGAAYTVLGPLREDEMATYEDTMGQDVPPALRQAITDPTQSGDIEYLRRDTANVIFRPVLSLGVRGA